MAWESRRGKGRYYTRSRKVNGRVEREYIGSGPMAEFQSALDLMERWPRQEEAYARRVERDRMAELDRLVADYCERVESVACAELEAAGYHKHNRGEWRRRRG